MTSELERSIATVSGTAALAVALRALALPGSYVAVPVTICPNVLAAIAAADCHPFFIDIERQTSGMDPAALKNDIDAVSAVIAVHASGNPCQIDEISELCRMHGKSLIEDCAQADGASIQGRSVGTWGDASVFSYGRGKILDLGGGGLLLGKDAGIQQRLQHAAESLPRNDNPAFGFGAMNALNSSYKELYNSVYPSKLSPHGDRFIQQLQSAGKSCLAQAPARTRDDILSARKKRLTQTIAARHEKRNLYSLYLAGTPGLAIQPASPESAPWRFNVWMHGFIRDKLLRSMLADGMNVSSWHPDIRPYLPEASYKSGKIVQALWYTEGILNLWLDDETSPADIRRTSDEIKTRIAAIESSPAAVGAY